MAAVSGFSEPRRLYQQVADKIRDLVASGEFPPGARLPAERELAQRLGVSRPSLREALVALEIDGSVEIRMGSGVYITAEPRGNTTETRSLGESPSELMQARAALEGAVILLAAARMTPETLEELRRIIDTMRSEVQAGRKPIEQDRQFHLTIAAQSGNAVLRHLTGDLFDERHSPISAQFRARFENVQTWVSALEEHEAILAALEARDPLLAQSAMHAHLEGSRRRWVDN